jgi:hypothetical protein
LWKGIFVTFSALVGVLAFTTAHADGGCANGYRDVTPAETATMTAVVETVQKGLPPTPQGWVIVGDENVSLWTTVCRGSEAAPWPYDLNRHYQRVDDQEAAQKGDYAQVEAINKEIEKASAEYKKVAEEGGMTEKMNAANAEASRDLTMSIVVEINPSFEAPGTGAESIPAPPGAQSAFRWSETNGSVEESRALVLFGQWRPASGGGLEAAPRADASAPAAHAISLRVIADTNRLASMLDAIDFKGIATALTK